MPFRLVFDVITAQRQSVWFKKRDVLNTLMTNQIVLGFCRTMLNTLKMQTIPGVPKKAHKFVQALLSFETRYVNKLSLIKESLA